MNYYPNFICIPQHNIITNHFFFLNRSNSVACDNRFFVRTFKKASAFYKVTKYLITDDKRCRLERQRQKWERQRWRRETNQLRTCRKFLATSCKGHCWWHGARGTWGQFHQHENVQLLQALMLRVKFCFTNNTKPNFLRTLN